MHFKNIILGIAAVALLLFATAQADAACAPDKVSEKYPRYAGKAVVVAVTPMTPPFAYTNPDNLDEIIGLEVELMEGVMACAGLEIEWLIGKWSGILPTVFSGASDLMIGNVVYSEDRAKQGDFVVFIRREYTQHCGARFAVRVEGSPDNRRSKCVGNAGLQRQVLSGRQTSD